MRGRPALPFAQFPAAEGSDRLHIARPKLRTREIKVSENSESNKEICEKRKSGEGWDFLWGRRDCLALAVPYGSISLSLCF